MLRASTGYAMPPIIVWVLGAVGAVAAAKWLAGEARRINAELYPAHDVLAEAMDREGLATLRRDPATGVYRPYRSCEWGEPSSGASA